MHPEPQERPHHGLRRPQRLQPVRPPPRRSRRLCLQRPPHALERRRLEPRERREDVQDVARRVEAARAQDERRDVHEARPRVREAQAPGRVRARCAAPACVHELQLGRPRQQRRHARELRRLQVLRAVEHELGGAPVAAVRPLEVRDDGAPVGAGRRVQAAEVVDGEPLAPGTADAAVCVPPPEAVSVCMTPCDEVVDDLGEELAREELPDG